jgi:hypothetical protein
MVYCHLVCAGELLSHARMGRLGRLLHPGVQPSHSAAPNTVRGLHLRAEPGADGAGFEAEPMCRWCVVMFILSVVGTVIIYWRI